MRHVRSVRVVLSGLLLTAAGVIATGTAASARVVDPPQSASAGPTLTVMHAGLSHGQAALIAAAAAVIASAIAATATRLWVHRRFPAPAPWPQAPAGPRRAVPRGRPDGRVFTKTGSRGRTVGWARGLPLPMGGCRGRPPGRAN